MSLTSDGQQFLDFALGALPSWMRSDDVHLRGSAKVFESVKTQADYWFGQTLIGQADGPTTGLPDWLNQHARDRGTNRQNGESNAALRDRLRNVPDALTRFSILSAANAILAAESISGEAAMLELPRDAGAFGHYVPATDTGGTWTAGTGTSMIFTPTVPFPFPPYRSPTVVRKIQSFTLHTAGSADSGNNGTFPITGLSGNGAIVTNASGVVGADAGVTWTVHKRDAEGNVRDGFRRAYFSNLKGGNSTARYRFTSKVPIIVIVLPYGSTSSTEVSVREMLRQKKAAGFRTVVERRLTPP